MTLMHYMHMCMGVGVLSMLSSVPTQVLFKRRDKTNDLATYSI